MGTPPLNIKREGRWKGDITIMGDRSSNNRADSRLNLKWLTEFKPIHDTPSFRLSCSSISKIRRPYRSSVNLCPIRAYHIFKNRSTNWHRDVENIQDLHTYGQNSMLPRLALSQSYLKHLFL